MNNSKRFSNPVGKYPYECKVFSKKNSLFLFISHINMSVERIYLRNVKLTSSPSWKKTIKLKFYYTIFTGRNTDNLNVRIFAILCIVEFFYRSILIHFACLFLDFFHQQAILKPSIRFSLITALGLLSATS